MNKAENRGRKKGSFSFVVVTLAELTEKVNATASVVVSKKWADGIGLVGKTAPAMVTLKRATIEANVEVKEGAADDKQVVAVVAATPAPAVEAPVGVVTGE
jgi:hypothetical protein